MVYKQVCTKVNFSILIYNDVMSHVDVMMMSCLQVMFGMQWAELAEKEML